MLTKLIPLTAVILLAARATLHRSALAVALVRRKVTKEMVIKASPERFGRVVSDFGAMRKWHPNVIDTVLERRSDAEGNKN